MHHPCRQLDFVLAAACFDARTVLAVLRCVLLRLCRGRDLLLQVAIALHHLHRMRVVHMDMKSK
jgi:hypothetical protein